MSEKPSKVEISIQGGWAEGMPDYDVSVNENGKWSNAHGIDCGPGRKFWQIVVSVNRHYPKSIWDYEIIDNRRKGGDYVFILTRKSRNP